MLPTIIHPTADAPMTTPEIAAAAGVPEWRLRAAVRRGFVEAPGKVGPMMLWRAGDLPRVIDGLVGAGYLPRGTSAEEPTQAKG